MSESRKRVVIAAVDPEIDHGQWPVKRVVGERVVVTCDLFADGHDVVGGEVLHRAMGARAWERVPLAALGNDRYGAEFRVEAQGGHEYTLRGWVDAFGTWRRDLEKRLAAGQEVDVELRIGADLVEAAAGRAAKADRAALRAAAGRLRGDEPAADRAAFAVSAGLLALVAAWPDLPHATTWPRVLRVTVDRERAGFSAWYEVFPRSTSPEKGRPGTFQDLLARLPCIADLGFDVVYLPPIHPIGRTHRKGRNNARAGQPGDVGSPWAIGAAEGGHDAVHPDLGTLADFRMVVARAEALGMEVALDLAFQCSPDHPWAKEHPEWFRRRPDGTIRYAENPPKKYEDIFPFDFESEDHEALWVALRGVVDFWVAQGVRIFRVDNPHTKSFRFWEWLIAGVKKEHPDVLFLSEAFTRPKVMYHLAKIGFTWSYTYFTWREGRQEFTDYLTELATTEVAEFFRPNFWPNTPDILPKHLVEGGRPMFLARLVLAATLSPNYGIYGPAFELLERVPREPGSEEYLDSEKYEVKWWDLDREGHLREEIAAINRIRRSHPAFREHRSLRFHATSNDKLLCYSRASEDGKDRVLVVVSLEPRYVHSGWTALDMAALGLPWGASFVVRDLLGGGSWEWKGSRNYVELDPARMPAHVFVLEPAKP